jgi:outer membrane lipoprotein-sorting protein
MVPQARRCYVGGMKILFLPALLVLAAPAMAAPATLDDVARSLKATTSLSARFAQTGADGRTLTGRMALARPGKVRFEYDGAKFLIVGDGRNLSFVDYAVRQVSQWPVRSTPLGILLSDAPDLAGLARIVAASEDGVIVEARDPKHPEFGSLNIRFERSASAPGGLALAGWTARDAQGGESMVRLEAVRYNADLSKTDWSFRDPRRAQRRAG